MVFTVIVMGYVALKLVSTPHGKAVYNQLASVWKSSKEIPKCSYQMEDIRGALVRYQMKNQQYPASLLDLTPKFLPNKRELHSVLDRSTDPNHVSFEYKRPAPNASGSTPVLNFEWDYVLTDRGQRTQTAFILSENLAGTMTQTQYVNGNIVSQAKSDMSEGSN
jgi:hypothetical protein